MVVTAVARYKRVDGGEKQRTIGNERMRVMRVAKRTKPAQRSALADDILCCFRKSTDVCAITRKYRAKRRTKGKVAK